MWILSAAVVIFGVLTTLNLILTLGVLKRLREQSEQLAHTGGAEQVEDPVLSAGEVPEDFANTTVDGEPVSRDDVTGARLVAFLSPLCDRCEAQIPGLLDAARSMLGGRDNVLVVIVGKDEKAGEYAARFRDVAKVVVEPGNGPITKAFKLTGLPAFALLDPFGKVVTSSITIDRLDIPVASGA
jgi:hypothetical protein